jgi:ferredoxin
MRIGVRRDLCQGHARCEAHSEFFTLDDDGYNNIGSSKLVPHGMEEEVSVGVAACPERALVIEAQAPDVD